MLRPIVIATLIAGTLDILSAFVFAGMSGMKPIGVLRSVASGPFGAAPTATPGWAAVGLAVHFAIMACMATAYLLAASRIPAQLRRPVAAGPLWGIANALFSHCILVGIPIALVARRFLVPREPGPA